MDVNGIHHGHRLVIFCLSDYDLIKPESSGSRLRALGRDALPRVVGSGLHSAIAQRRGRLGTPGDTAGRPTKHGVDRSPLFRRLKPLLGIFRAYLGAIGPVLGCCGFGGLQSTGQTNA